jgi:peptide/nickel transport system permease protein
MALILPAVTLGLNTMARIMRITRSSMLDVLGQDFVRTVRSKGLPERIVLFKHALRNAAVPIVALVGLQLGSLLGGAVLIETVFSWPGVGRLAVNAVYTRDFPLVQAVALLVTVTFSLVNLAVDLIAASLNPQIRLD